MSTSAEVSAKVSQMNKGGQNVLSAQEVLVEYTVTLLVCMPCCLVWTEDYTYHVTVRDVFGNIRDSGGDLLVARIHGPDSSAGNVTDLGKGDYVVTYRVVLPGAYEIETRVAEPQRGLTGYYYVDTASLQRNLASAVRAVDAVIDFDWRKNVSMRATRVLFGKVSFVRVLQRNIRCGLKFKRCWSAAGVYIDGKTVINGLNTATTSGRVMLVGGRPTPLSLSTACFAATRSRISILIMAECSTTSQLIPTQSLIAEASEILPRRQLVAVN
ncbi:Immunoglobulin E-set [Phytophthora cactorum]|nr:Immunoglobulin E-set [Phytophthora cactorum]